jgi:hypothetical protein
MFFSSPALLSSAQSPYPPPQTPTAVPVQKSPSISIASSYPAPLSNVQPFQTRIASTTSLNQPAGSFSVGNNLIHVPLVAKMPSYNRGYATTYADLWTHDRNVYFPNYGTGSNCNDCTNYLSQVLLSGGLPQILIDHSEKDWWYWCDEYTPFLCDNSKAWSATDWMNRHVSYYYRNQRFDYKNSVYDLEAGDFFLMDLPESSAHGIPNHARIVVGWGYPEEGNQLDQFTLLVNQHCTDRKRVRWNYNIDDQNYPINNDIDVWYVRVIY